MVIKDNEHLMMIEPKLKPKHDIQDGATEKARAIAEACTTQHPTRGVHRCICGFVSDNRQHVTPNGLITNSLLVHYVQHHRDEIPQAELTKLFREDI